jgi:hypothetical protein
VVQTLTAEGADQAFDVRSPPRRPRGRKDFVDAHILDLLREFVTEDPIAILEEITWYRVPREGLTELLCGPLFRRMRSDIEVKNPAPVESQHQENTQDLKPDRRHSEEVDRHHAHEVIVEEGSPSLRGRHAEPEHVLAYAGLTDFDTEFEQFAVDAGGASKRILAIQSSDQFAHVSRDCRSARLAMTNFSGPEQPEALSVPGNDGFRVDDDQGRSPIVPSLA